MENQGTRVNWKAILRKIACIALTKQDSFVLSNRLPQLNSRVEGLDSLGLYLHIPFCRQICTYCPYNKVLYHPQTARRYAEAVIKEIDGYAHMLRDVPITSFYIGGGTPTTMLHDGLNRILEHIETSFNMQCGIHMESHPNDLSAGNLAAIRALGIDHLSIGVEALQDQHLKTLGRPYTADQAQAAVGRAVAAGFTCVNADFLFALPHQTWEEVETTARTLISSGVDQVAAYPLFTFPYTRWSTERRNQRGSHFNVFQRRRIIAGLECIFRQAGFRRTSVWAFTRAGVPKYCSVTVPRYIGLGASGGSYLEDVFYLNTFNVHAYIAALEEGSSPIALSMPLSHKMQMAGWLYWRIYETCFKKSDFRVRFDDDYKSVFGGITRLCAALGLLREDEDHVTLNDHGAYWLHVMQDIFSIEYVSRLWGTSKEDPWPRQVVL